MSPDVHILDIFLDLKSLSSCGSDFYLFILFLNIHLILLIYSGVFGFGHLAAEDYIVSPRLLLLSFWERLR